MTGFLTQPPSRTDIYRRQARRLRWALRADPQQLHHSLRTLAEDAVVSSGHARQSPVQPVRPTRITTASILLSGLSPEVARATLWFLCEVRSHVGGTVVRYSDRLRLIHAAQELGIGRFHANLIIAAVQHEQTVDTPRIQPESSPRQAALVLAALLTQIAVIAGAWWMFSA